MILKVGIVGNGADKFTERGAKAAKDFIKNVLTTNSYQRLPGALNYRPFDKLMAVSGHSPMGGVDIWTEEIADELKVAKDIKEPKQHKWDAPYGYKKRNLDIAKASDILYVIVANKYPSEYRGKKWNRCYHCDDATHIKSGGCWTGKRAKEMGKEVIWVVIENRRVGGMKK